MRTAWLMLLVLWSVTVVAVFVLLAGCGPLRSGECYMDLCLEADAGSPPDATPSCGGQWEPCCFAKVGCTFMPQGGDDCVSPPDLTSQGICIEFGTCGNPGNRCCGADGRPGGDVLCEFNYICEPATHTCIFHGL